MAIVYEQLMQLKIEGLQSRYDERDCILYALGIGLGRDPLDRDELSYVVETLGPSLQVVPSMATVIGRPPLVKQIGADYSRIVHGDQYLRIHRPLDPAADIISDTRIAEAFDKGPGRGALIYIENILHDARDRQPIATHTSGIFARGDGGFGGPSGSGRPPHALPERAPDKTMSFQTRPDQALLYRLNGDMNPLHSDPDVARRAGFPAPILHGLCTYGIACQAVLKGACDQDSSRMVAFDARFSAPVFPGETILTDLWIDGAQISFRCRLAERDVIVLTNGRCLLN